MHGTIWMMRFCRWMGVELGWRGGRWYQYNKFIVYYV